MRAGRLDRQITLLRYQFAQDAATNAVAPEYVTEATVWAERKDVRGAEAFSGQQRLATAEVVFTIRWAPGLDPASRGGLDPTWRVREQDRLYEVIGVLELGRREALQLVCVTRAETDAPDHDE